MIKKHLVTGLVSASMVAALALPMAVMAQPISNNELLPPQIGTELGQEQQDLRITIARIIRTAMSLLGIIAVLIVLYGGFKWMTSQGSSDGVSEAKQIIGAGVVGLVIILTAYAIASFVIDSLVTATGA